MNKNDFFYLAQVFLFSGALPSVATPGPHAERPHVAAIVYGSQATIYAIRDRRHLWGPRPIIWLVLSSIADLLIISTLANRGIAMAPLALPVLSGELAAAVAFGLVLNVVKIPVFARLKIS